MIEVQYNSKSSIGRGLSSGSTRFTSDENFVNWIMAQIGPPRKGPFGEEIHDDYPLVITSVREIK